MTTCALCPSKTHFCALAETIAYRSVSRKITELTSENPSNQFRIKDRMKSRGINSKDVRLSRAEEVNAA